MPIILLQFIITLFSYCILLFLPYMYVLSLLHLPRELIGLVDISYLITLTLMCFSLSGISHLIIRLKYVTFPATIDETNYISTILKRLNYVKPLIIYLTHDEKINISIFNAKCLLVNYQSIVSANLSSLIEQRLPLHAEQQNDYQLTILWLQSPLFLLLKIIYFFRVLVQNIAKLPTMLFIILSPLCILYWSILWPLNILFTIMVMFIDYLMYIFVKYKSENLFDRLNSYKSITCLILLLLLGGIILNTIFI
jgi:hypothetical protein